MGSCCSKSSEVADSTGIVPSDNAKKSNSGPPKGNLILVGARAEPTPALAEREADAADEKKAPELAEAKATEASPAEKEKPAESTQVASSASADSTSPATNPPANGSTILSPTTTRKQLRASGSQMFANDAVQSKLNAEAAQAGGSAAGSRRVSRPSTPISRTGQAGQPASANQLSVNPNTAIGWPVAPNSPVFSEANATSASGGVSSTAVSNRATRRRSAETLKDVIPETIVEKIRAKKEAAPAQATSPTNALVSTGPQPSSRRSSGTFERVVTINKINPHPSAKKADEEDEEEEDSTSTSNKKAAAVTNGNANGGSEQHREPFKLGTRFSEPNARYELTSTQESELRAKPYLWTDPHVYRYHINACFTYYSTLPVRTASPLPSPTSAASSSSSASTPSSSPAASSLPSIHQNDRIVWSQLQQLSKDCIQRLYLLIKRDFKRTNPTLTDEKELDKKIWNKLEDLLPGHGNESQTTQCIVLAFLDHMAKSIPLTISRREFVNSFQEIHLALFCAPEDANMKERKKLMQNIYKLKLEELSQPFAANASPQEENGSNANSPASQVHSLFPSPIANVSRRSSGRMLEELAMRNNLERRNSVKLNELAAPSPTNAALNANSQSFGDVSRRGSFNAGSIDRLMSFFGDTSKDKEAISRRASHNLGESRDSGAGNAVIDLTPVVAIQTNGTSRRGSYQNQRRARSRSRSPDNKY